MTSTRQLSEKVVVQLNVVRRVLVELGTYPDNGKNDRLIEGLTLRLSGLIVMQVVCCSLLTELQPDNAQLRLPGQEMAALLNAPFTTARSNFTNIVGLLKILRRLSRDYPSYLPVIDYNAAMCRYAIERLDTLKT